MRILFRFFKSFVDIIEIYLPCVCMVLMFIVFMIGIISRYFFTQIEWTHEMSLVFYLWIALFGSLYAQREERHITFSVLYDSVSPRIQRIMRIIGNSLLLVGFLLLIKPSYSFISFMKIRSTFVLKIPFFLVYMPFLVFLIGMSIHFTISIFHDLKSLSIESRKIENNNNEMKE